MGMGVDLRVKVGVIAFNVKLSTNKFINKVKKANLIYFVSDENEDERVAQIYNFLRYVNY